MSVVTDKYDCNQWRLKFLMCSSWWVSDRSARLSWKLMVIGWFQSEFATLVFWLDMGESRQLAPIIYKERILCVVARKILSNTWNFRGCIKNDRVERDHMSARRRTCRTYVLYIKYIVCSKFVRVLLSNDNCTFWILSKHTNKPNDCNTTSNIAL